MSAPRRPDVPPLKVTARTVGEILASIRDKADELTKTATPNHASVDDMRQQWADLRHHLAMLQRMTDDIELALRCHRLAPLLGALGGVVFAGQANGSEQPAPSVRYTLASLGNSTTCRLTGDGKTFPLVAIKDVFPAF